MRLSLVVLGLAYVSLVRTCLFKNGFSHAMSKHSIIFHLKVLVLLKIISHLNLCFGCVVRCRVGSELCLAFSCSPFRTVKFHLVSPLYVSPHVHSAR